MTLIKTTNGPLCPMAYGPNMAQQHATMDHVSNVVFHTMQPMVDQDTGEAAPDVEKVANAARYGYSPEWLGMRLYRAETSLAQMIGNSMPVIEAWFFQCQVCGFVLPATARAVDRA
jgi:hypothetical protein